MMKNYFKKFLNSIGDGVAKVEGWLEGAVGERDKFSSGIYGMSELVKESTEGKERYVKNGNGLDKWEKELDKRALKLLENEKRWLPYKYRNRTEAGMLIFVDRDKKTGDYSSVWYIDEKQFIEKYSRSEEEGSAVKSKVGVVGVREKWESLNNSNLNKKRNYSIKAEQGSVVNKEVKVYWIILKKVAAWLRDYLVDKVNYKVIILGIIGVALIGYMVNIIDIIQVLNELFSGGHVAYAEEAVKHKALPDRPDDWAYRGKPLSELWDDLISWETVGGIVVLVYAWDMAFYDGHLPYYTAEAVAYSAVDVVYFTGELSVVFLKCICIM